MPPLIACNIFSFGPYRDSAYEHLPSLDIHHVEVPVPADHRAADELEEKLARHGLSASTMQGRFDLSDEAAVDMLRPQLRMLQRFGTEVLFLSVKAGELDRDTAYRRLREAGQAAADADVTLALETHPDLMQNGSLARETLGAVDHPRVRTNFDTANVHFHNDRPIDTTEELRHVADLVAAVHLKDTVGGYHVHDFPALGRGVVDFTAVFRILAEQGFEGPFTMELEGSRGLERSETEQKAYVAESVQYLREIGVLS